MKYTLSVTGITWWFEFLKFIAAVLIAFYIPGALFLSQKVIKSRLSRFTLAIIIGFTLWAWQEFIFGYFHWRNLTYAYLLICLIFWLIKNKTFIKKPAISFKKIVSRIKFEKADYLTLFLFVIGVYIQVLPIWNNGILFKNGFLFCCGNTPDNLWYASLTNEIISQFPPHQPGLPEAAVLNYHYWSNLAVAGLIRIFRLPLFFTQFRFFLLLISLLLGLSSISLAKSLRLTKKIKNWFLFFTYFSGDLIYLFLIILNRGPNYFIMSSLDDSAKFLYNSPRAFSHIIALGGLSLFVLWQKSKKRRLGILSIFLLASTTGFKIYTSIFLASGLVVLGLISLIKREWKKVFVYALFPLFSAIVYLPTNIGAGGLVWTPFVIVNNFIVQPALGLERYELARMIFFTNKKYLHNLIFELVFTAFFLVGVLGTKIIGFFQTPSSLFKLEKNFFILMIVGIFSSLPLGILFIQKSGGANTFNFIVSSFLFLSLFAALSINYWQKKLPKILSLILILTTILLTVPRVVFETVKNIKMIYLKNSNYLIPAEELELYRLTPASKSDSRTRVALDLDYGLLFRTPYPSLFLSSPVLLAGTGILRDHNIDITKKEKAQNTIFKDSREQKLLKQLHTNNVDYIILFYDHNLAATESAYFTKPIAKNKIGKVLQVDKEKLKERLLFYFEDLNDI